MVVATGFFDGVHIGHRHILARLRSEALKRGTEGLVATFWPHPRTVLQDGADSLRLLNSLDEKKALIAAQGISRVEVLPFTKEFSRLTAREYLRDYVAGRFGGSAVLLGYDNRLGSDSLTAERAALVASELGLEVIMAEPVSLPGGQAVSSTKIRRDLADGLVRRAASMLGYSYSLRGVVVRGERLGRTLGFPTANLGLYDPLKIVPANGVYKVEVQTLGRQFKGMCNIGLRPTVNGRARTIETNIFDFNEDIYGLDLKLTFLDKIREERRFPSLEALKAQLEKDRLACL